jgi:hypothetical protein
MAVVEPNGLLNQVDSDCVLEEVLFLELKYVK